MAEDSTREDGENAEDVDESVEMDDFKMYGSPTPTSNRVLDAISKLDKTEPERYLIERAGETISYETAYGVTKIGFGRGGRPISETEGRRGGEYVIDSNPSGKPRVEYHLPNRSPREERLMMMKAYDTKFEWKNWIKRRLGF